MNPEEQHPNFQREKFSKLPMTRTCNTCGEPADIVVHAFCTSGHCEKRSCVEECQECQDWIKAIEHGAPPAPAKDRRPDPVRDEYEYFSRHVTEGMEREFRDRREREHSAAASKFDSESDWIGYAGEEVFKELLKEAGIGPDSYTHHVGATPVDFTVRVGAGYQIDVKTRSCDRYPPSDFRVDYNERQLQRNDTVRHLVFAIYDAPRRALHLVCWNTKEEFVRIGELVKRGDKIIEGRNNVALYDFRRAEIRENRPIGQLREELRIGLLAGQADRLREELHEKKGEG